MKQSSQNFPHKKELKKSAYDLLENDTTAEAKVVVDKELNIIGAEIYAADAENVANMFAFIINKKIASI